MRALSDYVLVIRTVGSPPAPADLKPIDLVPGEGDVVSATIDALRASPFRAGSLKSRAIFLAPEGAAGLVTYAALWGFAGRPIDVWAGDTVLELSLPDGPEAAAADLGRVDGHLAWAQVGGPDAEGMPTVHVDPAAPGPVDPEAAKVIASAARLRMVPPAATADAFSLFALVAALRRRDGERFPYLSTGTEPVPRARDDAAQGTDLYKVWKLADGYRHELRKRRPHLEIVDAVPGSPHNQRLAEADAVDIRDVLRRLGSSADRDGRWDCPRRRRHRPGGPPWRLKVSGDNRIRCPDCDEERIGPVRLVVDVCTLTPDEAANVVLGSSVVGREPSLVGSAVTMHVASAGTDGFRGTVYDPVSGEGIDAFVPRTEAYTRLDGTAPPGLAPGGTVTALVTGLSADPQRVAERLFLSLRDPELVERLLTGFVDEMVAGRVVVVDSVRIPGARTKVAVGPTARRLDALGACTGHGGSRVRGALALLNRGAGGERLGIIGYASDPDTYLCNAMKPADVVDMLADRGDAVVAVPPEQMHAAVGQGGLNVELAGRLTGLRVTAVEDGTDLRTALDRAIEERRRATRARL